MARSLLDTLLALSDALAPLVPDSVSPPAVASVATRSLAQALGCDEAEIWLHAEKVPPHDTGNGHSGWLQRLPLIGSRLRPSPPPPAEPAQRLYRLGDGARDADATPSTRTLEELSGGAIAEVSQVMEQSACIVRAAETHAEPPLRLLAVLSHQQGFVGLLVCTWEGRENGSAPQPAEPVMLAAANLLGPLFAGTAGEPFEAELYLAGLGVLLTALGVGPTAMRTCAEAVARAALERATASGIRPAELHALQWAALFHEVGRLPMEHWLTFPISDREASSNGQAPKGASSLSVIPGLAPAAQLLDRVMTAIEKEGADSPVELAATEQVLRDALRTHCRQARSAREEGLTDSTPSQEMNGTEEPWDTLTPVANATSASTSSTV